MDDMMPQGRIVLKRICQSRKLAALKTDGARLLYTWLIPNVDVNGCFSGDAAVIKGQVFTRLRKSLKTIESYLQELQDANLVILYQANSDIYLNIPDFSDKQPYLNPDRETKTTIPPPTHEQCMIKSGIAQSNLGQIEIEIEIEGKSQNESQIKYMSIFDEARKLFRGTKRGNQTEFDEFCKKHKKWQEFLPLLKPAIEQQIKWREEDDRYWKNFKTWIKGKCWEEEGQKGEETSFEKCQRAIAEDEERKRRNANARSK